MRSAPTVNGSSTSSLIGSVAWLSMITGLRPKHISQASASIGVMAGTTEQIADPSAPSGEAISTPMMERINNASSSAVLGAAVVSLQCETSSSASNVPIVISELPTSKTTITELPPGQEIRTERQPQSPPTQPEARQLERFRRLGKSPARDTHGPAQDRGR